MYLDPDSLHLSSITQANDAVSDPTHGFASAGSRKSGLRAFKSRKLPAVNCGFF
jgi:hypothetical protein